VNPALPKYSEAERKGWVNPALPENVIMNNTEKSGNGLAKMKSKLCTEKKGRAG